MLSFPPAANTKRGPAVDASGRTIIGTSEIYRRSVFGTAIGGEVQFLSAADQIRDNRRKLRNMRIVRLSRLIVALTLDSDPVLCAFELILKGEEVLIR